MKDKKIAALWSHVHWLAVLAEQGSFTRAATYLNVSKASVSQRIAELEQAAGVPLVRRTTRSVRLTEAGAQLAENTRGAFDQIADSFEAVREQAITPQGTLRLSAPVALARQQLVPRLAHFLKENPRIRIELDLSDQLSSLSGEGFDLAIRHTSTPPPNYVAWSLCDVRSVLVASQGYLHVHGAPNHPSDLADHACLHYPRRQNTTVWTFERSGKKPARQHSCVVPVSGPFAVNNSEGLRRAAEAGLGITVLPDFSAQRALARGDLVQVLPNWRPVGVFGDSLYAIRPYTPHVPRATQMLVAYLREALSSGFPLEAGLAE